MTGFYFKNNKNMRLRKFRIVADSCPLHRKDCEKCRYSNGYDTKVYCYYGDKEWRHVTGNIQLKNIY